MVCNGRQAYHLLVTVAEQIEALVRRRPGLTEAELADALFPDGAYQQRVNSTCRALIKAGRVHRRGQGGRGDPFRYSPGVGPRY